MRVLNADQMREADRVTIQEIGIWSLVLMECAGRQVVSAIQQRFSDLAFLRIAVLCGPGNNGGDGFVIARTLLQTGYEASVFLIGSVSAVRGDPRVNLDILGRLGQTVVEVTNEQEWDLHFSDIATCDLVVDAMFGTGLWRPLSGLLETVVKDLERVGSPGGCGRSAERAVGRHAGLRWRGGRSGADGDLRGAQAAAHAAARRDALRRSRHRRHRHPARRGRRTGGTAPRGDHQRRSAGAARAA